MSGEHLFVGWELGSFMCIEMDDSPKHKGTGVFSRARQQGVEKLAPGFYVSGPCGVRTNVLWIIRFTS